MEAFDCGADHVYGVTLSSQLSGSYNSAELGKKLYIEEKGDKKIHIFDSKSASVGETLVGMKIQECEEAGLSFEEVIEKVESFIAEKNTAAVYYDFIAHVLPPDIVLLLILFDIQNNCT